MTDEIENKDEARQHLSMFSELYTFMRESTGIAITLAYIILLLSSMTYIHFYYSVFGISIIKYVTFEDILATPIKNPNIILTFAVVILLFFFSDFTIQFQRKKSAKFKERNTPIYLKLLAFITWAPKNRTINIRLQSSIIIMCLFVYIYAIASTSAERLIKDGGQIVQLTLAESKAVVSTTLLGTSVNYVFTYDADAKRSVVYNRESIGAIINHANEPEDSNHFLNNARKESREIAPKDENKNNTAVKEQGN